MQNKSKFSIARELRRAEATPQEIHATPQVEELGYEYGLESGKQALEDYKAKSEIDLERSALEEKTREYNISHQESMDMLRTWKKQNNIATMINLGATAITGLSGLSQLNKQEERNRKNDAIFNMQKETLDSQKKFYSGEEVRRKNMYADLFSKIVNAGGTGG